MPEQVDYVDADDRLVRSGPRGGAAREGLHHRVAATVLTAPTGPPDHVLVHRRPPHLTVLPGHYDVLVGGSVRAGESYGAAAARELAEELGVRAAHGGPHELWRERVEGPTGPCWLAVHHARLAPDEELRPDPHAIAWHAFVPLSGLRLRAGQPLVAAEAPFAPYAPFAPVGLHVLRALAHLLPALLPPDSQPPASGGSRARCA